MKKLITFIGVCSMITVSINAENKFNWQNQNAEVISTGDIKWKAEPFTFIRGESQRYIDFENGNDDNDGLSTKTAWKHHPWDKNAKGKAKEETGIHTYIFKRGVFYRGELQVKGPGEEGKTIRLTSSPDWGKGEAVIVGSERITNWKKGAENKNIPNKENVWISQLDFTPRALWIINEKGQIERLPLARTPNWKVSDPDDIKSEWWVWDNPGKPFDNFITDKNGKKQNLGIDTKHIIGDLQYFEDAIIWSEYGWVMGTPYPIPVLVVDIKQHALGFSGQWGGDAGNSKIIRNCRYYLEDKPHYLDDPDGEFWFEKTGSGGILHLRTPQNRDPKSMRIEVAKCLNLIDAQNMENIEISGLSFKFTNVYWKLEAPPFVNKDVDPACIRLLGSGQNITIKNCKFEHVNMAVRMKAVQNSDSIDKILISDNEVRYTDHGAFLLEDGGGWGKTDEEVGRLYDVKVLRNKLDMIGMRPTRYGQGHALVVDSAETLEISGNILDRCYGSGIHVFGSKRSSLAADRPLSRILIHHNKVTNSMLNTNDWGGIEIWQGGPAYVFNNISGNPGGYWNWKFKNHPDEPAASRFGHAYYLDGAFKNYLFNNIAWGKSKNPYDRLGNTSAFQEIHSYQNTFFNNTIYNFVIGSRRQAPEAGRNKYISNIWDGIGYMVFRHADPAKTAADANQADVGKQGETFAYNTNAYSKNVFHNAANFDEKSIFAVFEADGRWLKTFDEFLNAMNERKAMVSDIGIITDKNPLLNPSKHDFRPASDAQLLGKGAKVFVPWSLYAVVGEWNFYHSGGDPTDIIDEHWYMTPYYTERTEYHNLPMFPLKAVNVSEASYVKGELEDWINGAIYLNGSNQYMFISNKSLNWPETTLEQPFPKEPCEWAEIEIADRLTPGEKHQFKVTLKEDLPKGSIIQADFHWRGGKTGMGGMNSKAGYFKIDGRGPYIFEINPVNKPGLVSFELVLFVTPDGRWNSRSHLHRQKILASQNLKKYRLRSPQIENDSFIIETYFKIEKDWKNAIIVEKIDNNGYALNLTTDGKILFKAQAGANIYSLISQHSVNDNKWHHIVAECDRKTMKMKIFNNGKLDASCDGPSAEVSLANSADFFVGGSPNGRYLKGIFDFLRISQGSFADAKTTIDELYSWQFDGPFLRDFNMKKRDNARDVAGAIAQ